MPEPIWPHVQEDRDCEREALFLAANAVNVMANDHEIYKTCRTAQEQEQRRIIAVKMFYIADKLREKAREVKDG